MLARKPESGNVANPGLVIGDARIPDFMLGHSGMFGRDMFRLSYEETAASVVLPGALDPTMKYLFRGDKLNIVALGPGFR